MYKLKPVESGCNVLVQVRSSTKVVAVYRSCDCLEKIKVVEILLLLKLSYALEMLLLLLSQHNYLVIDRMHNIKFHL